MSDLRPRLCQGCGRTFDFPPDRSKAKRYEIRIREFHIDDMEMEIRSTGLTRTITRLEVCRSCADSAATAIGERVLS